MAMFQIHEDIRTLHMNSGTHPNLWVWTLTVSFNEPHKPGQFVPASDVFEIRGFALSMEAGQAEMHWERSLTELKLQFLGFEPPPSW